MENKQTGDFSQLDQAETAHQRALECRDNASNFVTRLYFGAKEWVLRGGAYQQTEISEEHAGMAEEIARLQALAAEQQGNHLS